MPREFFAAVIALTLLAVLAAAGTSFLAGTSPPPGPAQFDNRSCPNPNHRFYPTATGLPQVQPTVIHVITEQSARFSLHTLAKDSHYLLDRTNGRLYMLLGTRSNHDWVEVAEPVLKPGVIRERAIPRRPEPRIEPEPLPVPKPEHDDPFIEVPRGEASP